MSLRQDIEVTKHRIKAYRGILTPEEYKTLKNYAARGFLFLANGELTAAIKRHEDERRRV